ncbi:MAG: response regulator [Bdellovibrionota bacterium]
MEGKDHDRPILIIDDDEGVRNTLRDLFAASGFSVETANDGADGLAHLSQFSSPHTVLVDLMMPNMNGWEFFRHIKSSPELSRHRFAIISAFGRPDSDLEKYPFFSKPFDFDRLFDFCSGAAP